MEDRPEVGFDLYDKLLPSQDTLPCGTFGNPLPLPLQKKAREKKLNIFLDDRLLPFEDPWAFLSNLRKMGRREVERIVAKAQYKGRILGTQLPTEDEMPIRRKLFLPLKIVPDSVELILGSHVFIAKHSLPPALRNRLIHFAAFQNSQFYQTQALRFATYATPRIIACAEEDPHYIVLPRGCFEEVHQLLLDLRVRVYLKEDICFGKPLAAKFKGELWPEQQIAAEALLAHTTGVLSATTAFGKTVIAAWLIAQRQVSTCDRPSPTIARTVDREAGDVLGFALNL